MGLIDQVGSAVQSVGDTINDAADSVGDAVEDATDSTIGQVPVLGDAAKLGADAVDAQLDAVGAVADASYGVVGAGVKGVDDAAGAVADAAGAVSDAIPDPVKNIAGDVVDVVASGSFGRMANTGLDKLGAPDIVGDIAGTTIDVGVTAGLALGAIPTAGATAPAVAVSGAGAISNAMDALENVAGPDTQAGEWLKAGSDITGMFSGPAGVGVLASAGGRVLSKADDVGRLLGKADDAIGIGSKAAGWMDEIAQAGTKLDDAARMAANGADDLGQVGSLIKRADDMQLATRLKDSAGAIDALQKGDYLGAAASAFGAAAPGMANPAQGAIDDMVADMGNFSRAADDVSWVARNVGQHVSGISAQGAKLGEQVLSAVATGAGVLGALPDGKVDLSQSTPQIQQQIGADPDIPLQGNSPMLRPAIEMARCCHRSPQMPAHEAMMEPQVMRAVADSAQHVQQAQGLSPGQPMCRCNPAGQLEGPAGEFMQGNIEMSAAMMRVCQQDPQAGEMLMDILSQNQTMGQDVDLQSHHATHLHP